MNAHLKDLLPNIESWPAEDQEALAEAAREIEAQRRGVYEPSPEQAAGIERGLNEAAQDHFATHAQAAELRAKFRQE